MLSLPLHSAALCNSISASYYFHIIPKPGRFPAGLHANRCSMVMSSYNNGMSNIKSFSSFYTSACHMPINKLLVMSLNNSWEDMIYFFPKLLLRWKMGDSNVSFHMRTIWRWVKHLGGPTNVLPIVSKIGRGKTKNRDLFMYGTESKHKQVSKKMIKIMEMRKGWEASE